MVGRTRPRRAAARRLSPRTSGEVAQEEEDDAVAAEAAADAANEPPSTRRSTRIRRSQRGGAMRTRANTPEPTKKRTRSSAQRRKRSEKESSSEADESNAEDEEDEEEDETASSRSDSVKETDSKEENEDENDSEEESPVMLTRRRKKVEKEASEARGSNDDTPDEKNGSQNTDLNKGEDKEGGDDADNKKVKKRTALDTDDNNKDDTKKIRSENAEKSASNNEEAPPLQENTEQDDKPDAEFHEKKDGQPKISSQESPKEKASQSRGQSLVHKGSGEKEEKVAISKSEKEVASFSAERKDEIILQSRTDERLQENEKNEETVKETTKAETKGGDACAGSNNPPAGEWDKSTNGEDKSEQPVKKQQRTSSKQDGGDRGDSMVSKQSGGNAAVSNDSGKVRSPIGGSGNENADIMSKPQKLTTVDPLQIPVLVSSSTVGTVENQPLKETLSQSITNVKKDVFSGEKRPLDANGSELNKRQKVDHPVEPKDLSDKILKVQQPVLQMVDLNQIKVLLFSFGKRAHSSQGYERLFSEYWSAVSLLIEGRMPQPAIARSRATIKSFLKTKTLRRLHNRLISGLLERCTASMVPRHSIKMEDVPTSMKNRIRFFSRIKNEDDLKDVDHGDNLVEPVSLLPYTTITSVRDADEKKRPKPLASSLMLPGALIVDPHVRMIAQGAGLNVSENAVWLLVVAMKEYSSAILRNAVSSVNALENDESLPPPSIAPQMLGRRDYFHLHTNAKPSQTSAEQKSITSLHMHALTAGMQVGAPFSLGGCSSRLTFETSLFGALDNSVVADRTAFADLQAFMTSALAPPAERMKVEDQEPNARTDATVPISLAKDENLDQAELASIGSSQPLTEASGSIELERTPFGGLGRGAKDLASLKARSSILQKNVPPSSFGPGSLEVENVSTKIEGDTGSNTVETSAAAGALPSDVAGSATSSAALGGVPNQEPITNSDQVQHVTVHRKGKGAGVKNLAAMRARSLTIKPAEEEEKSKLEPFIADVPTAAGQSGESLDSSRPSAEPEASQVRVSMTGPVTGPQSLDNVDSSAQSKSPIAAADTERSQSILAAETHSGGFGSMDSAVQGAQNNEAVPNLTFDSSPAHREHHTPPETAVDSHGAPKQTAEAASSVENPMSDQPRKTLDVSPALPPLKSAAAARTDNKGTTEEEKPTADSSTLNTSTDEQTKKPVVESFLVNPTTSTPAEETAVESPSESPPTKPEAKPNIEQSLTDQASTLLGDKSSEPTKESKAEQKSVEIAVTSQPHGDNAAKTQRATNTAEGESEVSLAEAKDHEVQSEPVTAETK